MHDQDMVLVYHAYFIFTITIIIIPILTAIIFPIRFGQWASSLGRDNVFLPATKTIVLEIFVLDKNIHNFIPK